MMDEELRELAVKKQFMDSDEEDEYDEKKHAQLLDAIASLGGQHKPRLTQRTIPGSHVSEFGFRTSEDAGKVSLAGLVKSLKNTKKHKKLQKQLKTVQEQEKVVAAPLSKPETERLQRSVAYECTKADMSKWVPIVSENRTASQMRFPLNEQPVTMMTTDQVVKQLQPCTPLEIEVAALLKRSKNHSKDPSRELTPAEEKALRAMSLEEAKKRRAVLQKYRVLMSYKVTKDKRKKNIKSKKYHRVLKKERERKAKKALEAMKEKDPDGYLEMLQESDRNRIQERMSLKHRGGSKFARRQMTYGKFDETKKQAVHDMIQKNRELTKKVDLDMNSDEADEGDSDGEGNVVTVNESSLIKEHNPWMSSLPKITKISTDETENKEENDFDNKHKTSDHEAETEFTVDKMISEDSGKMSNSDNENVETNIEEVKSKKRKQKDSENTSAERKRSLRVKKDLKKSHKIDDKESDTEEVKSKKTKQKDSENTSPERKRSLRSKKGSESSPKTGDKSKKLTKNEVKTETDPIEVIFDKLYSRKKVHLKASDKKKLKRASNKNKGEEQPKGDEDTDSSDEEGLSESLTRKKTLEDMDRLAKEPAEKRKGKKKRRRTPANKKDVKTPVPENAFVDPNKLLMIETSIMDTVLPDVVDDDELDAIEQQRQIIEQAFADDDVVDEFIKEKSAVEDRDKPKDIDLTLPGWGEWGGSGVQPSMKKQKRFLIKAPPAPPRKDRLLGNVIISEAKDKTISKYQVSHLPFPCLSTEQFEQSIRAPIGKDWNPEMAFKRMVEPKVITKLGTIISPIDKEEIFKNQKQNLDKSFKGRKLKSSKGRKLSKRNK